MKRKLVMLALVFSTMPFIMAPGGTPPSDCSPGYWKNHTEVWMGKGCGGEAKSDETLLDMLTPGGRYGSQADREMAARILNNCAGLVVKCSE